MRYEQEKTLWQFLQTKPRALLLYGRFCLLGVLIAILLYVVVLAAVGVEDWGAILLFFVPVIIATLIIFIIVVLVKVNINYIITDKRIIIDYGQSGCEACFENIKKVKRRKYFKNFGTLKFKLYLGGSYMYLFYFINNVDEAYDIITKQIQQVQNKNNAK